MDEIPFNSTNPEYPLEVYAKALFKAGHYELACELFMVLNKRFVQLRYCEKIGDCLVKLGRHTEAITYLWAVVGGYEKQFRAHYLLAVAHKALGHLDLARVEIEKSLAINPEFKEALRFAEELPPQLSGALPDDDQPDNGEF